MQMLYHVADLGAALAEIVRVLRPGGWVLITTNSGTPTRSAELYRQAVEAATGEHFDRILPPFDFDGESAPRLLEPYFETIEPVEHVAGFKVTDAEALVGPLDSVREPVEATIGRSVSWPDAFAYVTSKAASEIRDTGAYRYEQHVWSFICRTSA
jgi:SAM-dependent methyltransferase